MAEKRDINDILLKAHRKGVLKAIDDSERTGIPLAVYQDGKVVTVPPKFKYLRVPVTSADTTDKNTL